MSNNNILSNNLKQLEKMENDFITPILCSCSLSLQDIKTQGRFGCSNCYNVFKDEIKILLPHIHNGAKTHIGKKPKNCISYLNSEIEKAIKQERYEDAAQIRERIKNLEKII